MLKNIQTYILVTLTALLIWVLAEAESVRVVTRPVDVEFRADPASSRVFLVEPEFKGAVSVRLEGPTAAFDALTAELRGRLILTPEMLNLPAGTGKFAADLKSALRAHPVFRNRGVTPMETTPQSVTLDVDDLVSRDVRVAVAPPEGALLQGVPEPTPATVRLRLPSRLQSILGEDAAMLAVPELGAVSRLPPGRPQTLPDVRLELPAAIKDDPMAAFARPEPSSVSVSLTVQSGTDTVHLSSVPVSFRIAPNEYTKWDVQIDPEDLDITDVSVTGPRDLMAQIEPGKRIQVFAVVPLDWQQLEAAAASGEPVEREVMFALSIEPAAMVRFEASKRTVRLTVRRRPEGAAPAASPPG